MLALPCLMEPPHSSSFITEEGARRRVTFSLGPVCIWRKSSCLSLSLVYFLCPWDILLNSHLTSMNPVSKFSLLPVPTLLPIKICFYLSKVSLSPKFYSRNFDSVTYFFLLIAFVLDSLIHEYMYSGYTHPQPSFPFPLVLALFSFETHWVWPGLSLWAWVWNDLLASQVGTLAAMPTPPQDPSVASSSAGKK